MDPDFRHTKRFEIEVEPLLSKSFKIVIFVPCFFTERLVCHVRLCTCAKCVQLEGNVYSLLHT